jgi:hypothetical protein
MKRIQRKCQCGRPTQTVFEYTGYPPPCHRGWWVKCDCGIDTFLCYSAQAAWAEWRKLQEGETCPQS